MQFLNTSAKIVSKIEISKSACFSTTTTTKTKTMLLKFISFHFKTSAKPILVFSLNNIGKKLNLSKMICNVRVLL